MKTRRTLCTLLLAAALCCIAALAAGGDQTDPLISLDYLQNVFRPAAEERMDARLENSGVSAYDAALRTWNDALAARSETGMSRASVWSETRLKQGDVLHGVTGTQVLLLAGGGTVSFESGAVIDVTEGSEVASGSALLPRHRYLVAEDTSARFAAASRTLVLDYCGDYRFALSNESVDYNAAAAALKALSLLKGTDTGFGQGFDLEKEPARIEALIMLIRLLGEEDAALACTAEQPFSDVPDWASRYVAYAAEMGYTNGIGGGQFGTTRKVVAVEYVEFVLRALGYSSTAQTDISDALERARDARVITEGEQALLQEETFLRADVAYLSYYALECPLAGTGITLHEKLQTAGVFTPGQYESAKAQVGSARL